MAIDAKIRICACRNIGEAIELLCIFSDDLEDSEDDLVGKLRYRGRVTT